MANSREIIKRLKSVGNIRKITRTMEMIATAKFKKAFDRAVGSRPYSDKISQMVGMLASGDSGSDHPLLQVNSDTGKTLLLVITANRGLCGGYIGNILRRTNKEIEAIKSDNEILNLRVSGKKGLQYFKFINTEVEEGYQQFDDKTSYKEVEELADDIISLYTQKKIDKVKVVYTRFESASKYYAHTVNLLPLTDLAGEETEKTDGMNDDYIFSPSGEEILNELIPTMVRLNVYQCFLDAIVSEQVARMSAMKAATDNAEEMIKSLGQLYNRARQSQITGELLDIMGGVEAMK